VFKAIQPGN